MKLNSLILFYFLSAALCQAQGKLAHVAYQVHGAEERVGIITLKNESLPQAEIHNLLSRYHADGYLAATVIYEQDHADTLHIKIATGERFNWLKLKKGNIPDQFLIKAGYDPRTFDTKPVQYQHVASLFDRLIKEAENNGFPFAIVRLDSLERQNASIGGSLNLALGPKITFDSLQITGNSKTKQGYLAKYLQIIPGEPFSQLKVNQAVKQVRNLPYLRWSGEPEISFQNEEATVYLPINDRKVNTIDGIIGFLPNEFEENKLLVTGQFDLSLFNVGGKGRNYQLNWQRLSQYTQNLRISAIEPMILGSKIDVGASFSLLKEDTTFLNRDFRIDFGYRILSDHYLKFFSRRQAGDLLATFGLQNLETLPEIADFRFNNYGLQYQLTLLDDVFLPRKGFFGAIEFAIGNKNILENTGLPSRVYEDINLRTIQFYAKVDFEKHFYFRPQWGMLASISTGLMENENLLINDLYRLGGLRSIRGFNENYFFANNYMYFNIEPRFYFDTYSYFMIFVDGGRLENRTQGLAVDYPFATGLGFSLETGNGIFNFIYAIGRANAQDFALNLSKIHFGYTGRF
ncbi:BamA/TamA family outer membrane protein [Belliella sp. DSM 111904]|uniref:BamA/TamA family outer membrane protein n=1 Tax=Belliella filtrata TaxID=2923435 RepID=A0ABS9UZH8_9BACT|nr:POTRA domain-containing protein [Belliella filtrata]MCH7409559.1 BamA/TamA family outer membrane protein [Belliella filtrata]